MFTSNPFQNPFESQVKTMNADQDFIKESSEDLKEVIQSDPVQEEAPKEKESLPEAEAS